MNFLGAHSEARTRRRVTDNRVVFRGTRSALRRKCARQFVYIPHRNRSTEGKWLPVFNNLREPIYLTGWGKPESVYPPGGFLL